MENHSGIHPTERKVLVKPIKPPEKTAGGIILADMSKDYAKYTTIVGELVERSPLAFDYASPEEWKVVGGKKPEPGALVMYAKNAGSWVPGKDGDEYLMLNDQDIVSTVDADYDFHKLAKKG